MKTQITSNELYNEVIDLRADIDNMKKDIKEIRDLCDKIFYLCSRIL